jgi:hypothetical protein
MGFAEYNRQTKVLGTLRTIFPRTNHISGSPSCLRTGDTFKFGKFATGVEIAFWLQQGSGNRYWSYLDPPTLTNPAGTCIGEKPCRHSAWAYLPEQDITVYGMEDWNQGDWDYNDLVFFLWVEGGATWNEVPPYEDGLIKVCNPNSGASTNSLATVNCTQWALLESTSSTQSCLTYMPIPAGWIWAPNDVTSRAIISALASKWAYTNANCFLLSTNATSGVGYRPNGSPCSAGEYNVTTIINGTQICYNAKCTSRFVLKGANLGVGCTSANRCSPDVNGQILAIQPESPVGATLFPTTTSVFLKTSTGVVDVTTTLQLPGPTATVQKIDIVVLADFSTVPTNKRDGIISSWASMATSFSTERLDPRFAFVQYTPAASSYTLASDFTLTASPAALTTSNFPSSPASCPASSPMYQAVAEVMNNAQLNWRQDSFKVVWVHSACALTESSVMAAASRSTGVVPVLAYAGTTSGNTLPATGYAPTGNNLPPIFSGYKSSDTWASPFAYASSTNTYPRGAGIMRHYPTSLLAVAISGDVAFVSGLPTAVNIVARTDGQATISYQIKWPSSGYPYNAAATYQVVLRVMGRGTVTFPINFNHIPVLPDISYSFVGNVNQTINLNPTDADGNTLNVQVTSYPTKGKLYDMSGVEITPSNQPPAGAYQMVYAPNRYVQGTDSASFTVNDGCATDPGTVTLSITYANTAPVAQDISIEMEEDSTTAGSNGLINFNLFISDADITAGVVSQTLSVIMVSDPSPSTRGDLVFDSDKTTVVEAGNTNVPKLVRFKLNQPYSGYGVVTFSYRVSDGTNQGNALSNIATVTITIKHKNHPPALTISNTHLYAQSIAPGDVLLDGYVTDLDFVTDSMNVYVVASTLNQFSVKVGSRVFSSGTPMPFQLYTSNFTSATSTYPVSNLYWTSTGVTTTETVTLRAIDSAGGLSNTVTVTFTTTPSFPPTWSDRPLNASTSFAPLTMMQGDTLSGLRFAATDADNPPPQWQTLRFSLTTPPSNGVVRIVPFAGGASVASNSFEFSFASNGTLVDRNVAQSASYFYVSYTPNPTFYGSDTFTFNVRDDDSQTAAEPANVIVHVARRNTPPVSADIEIHLLEATPGTGSIPVDSTNGEFPVYLTLESYDFDGSLTLEDGTPWIVGASTPESEDPFVVVRAIGLLGVFSDADTPTGTFTYRVHETDSGLASTRAYTAQIFVSHVNHAPTSENQADRTKRRQLLQVTLQAQDIDNDDPPATITANFASISVSAKGSFFFDAAGQLPLTASTLGTRALTGRTFWYRSDDAFSTNDQPLATYTFYVTDRSGLRSALTYSGSIIVDPAGDVPMPTTLDVYTYQETPVPMVLGLGVTTETGADPVVRVVSPPTKGQFSVCDNSGICVPASSYPVVVSSSTGRVVFVPRDDDWGMNFTSFPFTLTDPNSGAVGEYTMRIHVYHVNKRPFIAATNFLTTAQSNQGIIVNESSYHVFDWHAWDSDSLPNVLTTNLRVSFYTTYGFSLYTCNYVSGHYDSPNCAFDITQPPFAVRSDFTKNARRSLSAFETATTDCTNAEMLKARLGERSENCEAHFKLVFAPTPFAAYTPYISISFTATDEFGEESAPISALIYVKALNTPPTIWSPPNVLGAQGVTNPFIRDTDQSSETYNRPVEVDDVDANGNPELLTISVTEGSGNLIWPSSVPCSVSPDSETVWYCRDRIPTFAKWLSDLRFEVTSGDRATIRFEINDLGFSSDYKPSPNQTAESFTTILIAAEILVPKGNSSTLAIAVGVAAAVGLLLLGALGFFLRRAVAPPKDDYFSAATTPLSAAPQSPLYQAQNQTHENALYKARS